MDDCTLRIFSGKTPEYWENYVHYMISTNNEMSSIITYVDGQYHRMLVAERNRAIEYVFKIIESYLMTNYNAKLTGHGSFLDIENVDQDAFVEVVFPDTQTMELFLLKFS